MTGHSFGTDELAQFKATFFDESAELLADLDERLALLQDEAADSEALNAIFRAVHSIKAGAGAFGFSQLVEFAHRYEALLDRMRDGVVQQSEPVVDVLIRAGDILAALVEAARTETDKEAEFGGDVIRDLDGLLADDTSAEETPSSQDDEAEEEAGPDAANSAAKAYRIEFTPHAALFRHANEPLLLIRELKRLGDVDAECLTGRLPGLQAMEPEDAYLSWVLTVTTGEPEESVREVFEFVEDDCDLKISEVSVEPQTDDAVQPVDAAAPECADIEQEAPPAADEAPEAGQDETVANTPTKAPAASSAAVPSAASGVTSIRVDLDRVDRMVNVVGELVIVQSMLAEQACERYEGRDSPTSQGHEEMSRIVRELQECVMAIRMQPVKSVFSRMPRLVREVSGKLDKQVRLLTEGEQTEVDKTVIEELADPLTHMIRNAIDHGIEHPDTREANGKKPLGVIKLTARHAGGNIIIQVIDNGGGIDRKALLKKAMEKGIVSEGAKLSDEEIDDLIFSPGFSTAKSVTDVSGRGVGMDVVRRNINKLGGRIAVQSVFGKGTCFTLTIPLSLAVLDGMLVAIGAEKYILPLTSIIESFQPLPEQIRSLAGGGEVVSMRGEYIRLIHLHDLFNIPGAVADPSKGLVVVTETANGAKIGLLVDELIGQQQVVIKSIQENFDPVPGVSGATILGNGRVALILDLEQLKAMPMSTGRTSRQSRQAAAGVSDRGTHEAKNSHAPSMTNADGTQMPATV